MDTAIILFLLRADGKIYIFRSLEQYRTYRLWTIIRKRLKNEEENL